MRGREPNAPRRLVPLACALALVLLPSQGRLGAAASATRPEEVGLSAERLQRVGELVQRHIAAGSFSGAVTLVARNGRIAYHEAYGSMDLATKMFPIIPGGTRSENHCSYRIPDFNPLRTDDVQTTALFGAGWVDRISPKAILNARRKNLLSGLVREMSLGGTTR